MKLTQYLSLSLITAILSSSSHAFTMLASTVTAGWDTKTLTFDVNETSCTTLGITAVSLNTAIDAAIELWNSTPTTSLKLARGTVVTTTAPASTPMIYCSNTAQQDGVAGVGTVGQVTGGHPSTGAIAINGDSTMGAYFNKLGNTYQAIVIAHEMGHILGLGHSEKQYALMYYDISSKENLSLSQDDVDGLTWLNPRSDFSDGIMGCGTISDVGGNFPPPSNGNGAVALNWMFLLLITFAASKIAKTRSYTTHA